MSGTNELRELEAAKRELEVVVEAYEHASGGADEANLAPELRSDIDTLLLHLITTAADAGHGNLAVAAARIWHRREVPDQSELKRIVEDDGGNDDVPDSLGMLHLRNHAHEHRLYRTYLESMDGSTIDEEGPPRGDPDLGDEGMSDAGEQLYYDLRNLREEYFSRGYPDDDWFALNDPKYWIYAPHEGEAPLPPWMPSFEDRPVKDARTVTPKGTASSVDRAELRAALPAEVSMRDSGYDARYRR